MEPLIHRFKKAAKQYSDNLAVVDGERSLAYADLHQLIIDTAQWLHNQCLGKGDRVGIHLSNSIEYVVLYYACWQANLVPVAINTLASPYEVKNWTERSGCKLVFSLKLKQDDVTVPVCVPLIDSSRLKIDNQVVDTAGDYNPEVLLNDVATIIFTSGTTGNPKGITLSHKNLTVNINAIVKSLSIVSSDVQLCVLPFFYSFGNSVLHTHLVAGATLVLFNQVMYPAKILKTVEQHQCTGFSGVPSIYISLLKKTDFNHFNLSSLRYMTQAGGPLSREFIDQLTERLPDIDFVVMYGQTEASARISYLPTRFLGDKLGSVGIGIEGVTITVEDPTGKECAPDVHGEICVQGDSVMQGYWNNPEATLETLRGGKLLTGDMGYKDKDGFLYIVGRQSEMLKISEHRVSPYEIEEILLQHSAVEECAVIGCSHAQMGQVAKAFVVKKTEVTSNQLKKFCKQYLAGYKIPKEIEFIESLPKTSSGKIKRNQLVC